MDVIDSPWTRLLKQILTPQEQADGAYENPDVTPGGGKWSEPGVPHRGWHVVDYYKSGEQDHVCEMCEKQRVMFVHVMRHEDYPDDLKVGCVCAGHMEEDLDRARQREVRYRNKAKRRDKWLSRRWRSSFTYGGEYLRTDGLSISVYPNDSFWSATIRHRATEYKRDSERRYKTSDEAKYAAFEVMMDWLEKKPWEKNRRSRTR